MMNKVLGKLYRRFLTLVLGLGLVTVFMGSSVAQTWTPVGPIPRWGHSAIFDDGTRQMIVFGGQVTQTNANPPMNLNDVWRLSANGKWTSVIPTGTAPVGRLWHSTVYDEGSNRMVVFGGALGFSSPCANDVWVLANANGMGGAATWGQLSPVGDSPVPRAQHGSVYDPTTNTMIMYGGQDCFHTLFSDVWVLSNANGLGGTPTWTQLFPSGGGPGAREITGGVAYDSSSNRMIVFGGSCNNGDTCNDVWILSNANGQGGSPSWIQLSPTGVLPPTRASQSTVYDAARNRLIVFGGSNLSGQLGDTWVLSHANGLGGTPSWTQLGPFGIFPEKRSYHSGVYSSSTNRMVIFGGFTNASDGETTNDVWILSN